MHNFKRIHGVSEKIGVKQIQEEKKLVRPYTQTKNREAPREKKTDLQLYGCTNVIGVEP